MGKINIFYSFIELLSRKLDFFWCQCHHMSLMDFVVSPPDCGRSVTDVWGWDAHEAQLRFPDEVDGDIRRTAGGTLNLSYTKLPNRWSPWESSASRRNPHGRNGNRTREIMISSQKLWPLDHEASHKIRNKNVWFKCMGTQNGILSM
jgi:hypothetical protein